MVFWPCYICATFSSVYTREGVDFANHLYMIFSALNVRRTLKVFSWYHARKLYIRRNNNKFDSESLGKGHRVTDHLLLWNDQENGFYITVFLVTDEKILLSSLTHKHLSFTRALIWTTRYLRNDKKSFKF